jgi:hypothetical protein
MNCLSGDMPVCPYSPPTAVQGVRLSIGVSEGISAYVNAPAAATTSTRHLQPLPTGLRGLTDARCARNCNSHHVAQEVMMRVRTLLAAALLAAFPLVVDAQGHDPSRPCVEQLRSDASVVQLTGKYVFDITGGQPLEVLANSSKPSPQDQAALSDLLEKEEQCLVLGADWRAAHYPPELIAAMSQYLSGALDEVADLYAGKSTYGETARRRAALLAQFQSKQAAIVSDLQQRRAKAQDEIEARRQLALSQQEEARRMEIIDRMLRRASLPQPTIAPAASNTQCFTIGSTLNCSTH